MNGELIFRYTFCNAMNQYTTVSTMYVLDQIIYVTVQPRISLEIQNSEKYILSGYISKLKLYL